PIYHQSVPSFLHLYFLLFIDPAPTETYTLSLHDALPIFPTSMRDPQPVGLFALLDAAGNAERRVDSKLSVIGLSLAKTGGAPSTDRKSTRLNSSHRTISYAVFCLKKKKRITVSPFSPLSA